MSTLESLDVAGFRFVNDTLSCPLLDAVLPWFSSNPLFKPAVALLLGLLLWKGGRRGRVYALLLVLTIAVGELVFVGPLKEIIGRPRPFLTLPEVHLLLGRGQHASMPSGHAANAFAATMVSFLFYRRTIWFLLPTACLVAVSRLYVGVHYPSDVLAGALLGSAYAVGIVRGADALWHWAGRRWFPLWWARLPTLLQPERRGEDAAAGEATLAWPSDSSSSALDAHYLRLGYVLIAVLLLGRLAYLASDKIELSEDEAYQWLWSKHLALSYYSKPPLIAYTQWLGTHLWGDTEFGVRFFSPVIAAALSGLLLRFLAREANVRVGLWVVLAATATPLLAVGSTLLTIDPLSVLFWTAAMITGWRAVRVGVDPTQAARPPAGRPVPEAPNAAPLVAEVSPAPPALRPGGSAALGWWLLTGWWMGLGFLSKYTALFQILCWAVFFALWKPARAQLRRPGPWLALLVMAVCTLPVLVWNAQHGWITVTHLEDRAGLNQAWRPTLRYLWDFLGAEFVLLNPVFFVATVWAAVRFWPAGRTQPLRVYLFAMGAPLFLVYLGYTARARVQPNWIAPAVIPLFCLAAVFWEERARAGSRAVRRWLTSGLAVGLVAVVLGHDTNLIGRLTGHDLPAPLDPLRRVRGWRQAAALVGEARAALLREGRPVFIIGDHYGICGLLSFYLPEAKAGVPDQPLVYFMTTDRPVNQFYFWPGYQGRRGENALFVQTRRPGREAPEQIQTEFTTVRDLGVIEVMVRGRVFHRLQLFECRGLR